MTAEHPVLILAPDQDRLSSAAHRELVRRAIRVLRLDPANLPRGWDLSWSVESGSGFAGPSDCRVELHKLRSVLVRAGRPPARGPTVDEDRDYVDAEIKATMLGLLAGLDCRVINRPMPGRFRRSILMGEAEVAASGLRPTPTLMTSDVQAALAFYRDTCDRRALVGPPSGCSPSELIEGESGARLLAARALYPILLQAAPAGTSQSVWVAGERWVCVNGVAESVGVGCVAAARGMGLGLARFDLVVSPEHAACLEISPLPDVPDDAVARDKLVDALCDLLVSDSVAA